MTLILCELYEFLNLLLKIKLLVLGEVRFLRRRIHHLFAFGTLLLFLSRYFKFLLLLGLGLLGSWFLGCCLFNRLFGRCLLDSFFGCRLGQCFFGGFLGR